MTPDPTALAALLAAATPDWRLRLRPMRESFGMGLTATARLAGISKAYLWRIERGGAEPSVRVARAIAAAFRVPLSTLVDLDQEIPAPASLIEAARREAAAMELLRRLRDADVIFGKGDWPLSQEIAAFLELHPDAPQAVAVKHETQDGALLHASAGTATGDE